MTKNVIIHTKNEGGAKRSDGSNTQTSLEEGLNGHLENINTDKTVTEAVP